MADTATPATALHSSRAVLRRIEAGSSAMCVHCGDQVKFTAKIQKQQVICNVYVDGKWDRVEHFHAECYAEAGEPYDKADEQQLQSRRRAG